VIAKVEGSAACNEVGVLPCNWLAVRLYRSCQWTLVLGQGAVLWQGVPASELRAALLLHRVPRPEWEDTCARVELMVAAARPLLNAKR
jgi:hypothetical protein